MLTFEEFVIALHRLYPQDSLKEVSSNLKRSPNEMIFAHCQSLSLKSQEIIDILYENALGQKSIDGKRELFSACLRPDRFKLHIIRLLI